jgi:multicomponent K+:H+ antiporter subunit D
MVETGDLVSAWLQHLVVAPLVLPLCAGAAMLLLPQRRGRAFIGLLASCAQLAVAITLLYLTSDPQSGAWPEGIGVYSIGAWGAPYGIVLVVDRLSALMLVLAATLILPVLTYSLAGSDRAGVHYHPLLQFLSMGLSGAFLTGDIFNLFVFFEITLAASYGLVLHGPTVARVKAGLHYIVVNLIASLFFLIGAALIYGIAGTLNMADLGTRIAELAPTDRGLFEAGVVFLGVAFLVKAASWPLNFWLPSAYASASVAVAAVFCILTKLGVYSVLRVGSLVGAAGIVSPLAGNPLLYAGLATIVFAILGMIGAQQLRRLVAFAVVASSGTVLAAVGLDAASMTAPALFYLLVSVLATAAFFMLCGTTDRARANEAVVDAGAAPIPSYAMFGKVEDPGDARESYEEVGVAIPAATAFLGLMFVCCTLLIAGLPPLSGFVAKFALLAAAFDVRAAPELPIPSMLLIGVLLASGLVTLIACARIGMRLFWSPGGRATPRLRALEAVPAAVLVVLCIALTFYAAPVMSYLDQAAEALHTPRTYIHAVLATQPERAPVQSVEP